MNPSQRSTMKPNLAHLIPLLLAPLTALLAADPKPAGNQNRPGSTAVIAAPQAVGAAEPQPAKTDVIELCVGPNLFIDDYLIAESRGLKRTTHQPEKRPEPVFQVTPGNVTYDSDAHRFRMLYVENGPSSGILQYALAESTDGIDWQKPVLGLVNEGGSNQNNFIVAPKGGFQGQFIDDGPAAPDGASQYKLAF